MYFPMHQLDRKRHAGISIKFLIGSRFPVEKLFTGRKIKMRSHRNQTDKFVAALKILNGNFIRLVLLT